MGLLSVIFVVRILTDLTSQCFNFQNCEETRFNPSTPTVGSVAMWVQL